MENDKKDVSMGNDFIFFLQHAIALENHCLESYAETKDSDQLEIAMRTRRIRSKWMYKFVKESKNQIYCESKHIPGCVQALKEMANRFYEYNELELSKECLEDSAIFEAIFFLINEEGGKKWKKDQDFPKGIRKIKI